MRVLISEDNPVASRVLKAILTHWGHDVVVTDDGEAAFKVLSGEDAPPLAILDWEMPKLNGTDVCRRLRALPTPASTYLILLTAKNSREALVEGLEAGADDFVTKPFDQSELRVRLQAGARIVDLQLALSNRVRALEAAIIERQRAEDALRMLSLTDDLTALLNRRGFTTLAEHQLKAARRTGLGSMLVFGDLDGLKKINDTFGHNVGSAAIVAMADVMRRTFRESDLLARLGGDEFTILVANVDPNDGPSILNRFQESLSAYVREDKPTFNLAISLGATYIEPGSRKTIEELTADADEAMYQCKRERRSSAVSGGKIPNFVIRTLHPETSELPHEITAG
jgi:two-component system cell cycle response regulator